MDSSQKKSWLQAILAIVVLGVGGWTLLRVVPHPTCGQIHEAIAAWGAWAPAIYVLASTVGYLIFVPRTLLVVVAGLMFGLGWGMLLATISSMLGAALAFAASKHFAREAFQRRMGTRPWFHKLEEMTEDNGLSFVLLIRLIHIIPYTPLNYASGLLGVTWRDYLLGSFLGLLPGTFALLYAGRTLGCALIDNDASLPPEMRLKLIGLGVVMAALSFLPLLLKRRKEKRISPAAPQTPEK